mmetsp:Transcript_93/g.303  ORF Transcript_93/g.303 Transcript_93/m.303 type:complete len:230 (+) Transcript_93:1388-2077(+)
MRDRSDAVMRVLRTAPHTLDGVGLHVVVQHVVRWRGDADGLAHALRGALDDCVHSAVAAGAPRPDKVLLAGGAHPRRGTPRKARNGRHVGTVLFYLRCVLQIRRAEGVRGLLRRQGARVGHRDIRLSAGCLRLWAAREVHRRNCRALHSHCPRRRVELAAAYAAVVTAGEDALPLRLQLIVNLHAIARKDRAGRSKVQLLLQEPTAHCHPHRAGVGHCCRGAGPAGRPF